MNKSQYEAMYLLNEECGEIVKAIGKLLRHGPECEWAGVTNIEQVSLEIADVIGVLKILKGLDVLNWEIIEERIKNKFEKGNINRWLHNFQINPEWYKERI